MLPIYYCGENRLGKLLKKKYFGQYTIAEEINHIHLPLKFFCQYTITENFDLGDSLGDTKFTILLLKFFDQRYSINEIFHYTMRRKTTIHTHLKTFLPQYYCGDFWPKELNFITFSSVYYYWIFWPRVLNMGSSSDILLLLKLFSNALLRKK